VLPLFRLPNVAKDFAADAETAAGLSGQDALGRREDGESEAIEDPGNLILAAVHPATRT
jgi:hypothetical protein